MILRYFANHYANGGTWTHIVTLYKFENKSFIEIKGSRIELRRATDVLKNLKGKITKEQKIRLKDSMKWREDLFIGENGKYAYDNINL